jgi:hypothetical protein
VVANIIQGINSGLQNVLNTFFKSVLYGQGEVIGEGLEKKPVLIDMKGNAAPIGVDDRYAVQGYHLINQITTSRTQRSGYGDSFGDVLNTVSASLIVFNDTGKTKLTNDELFLFLQANWPQSVSVVPYSNVRTILNNVILNSRQVWGAQYGAPFSLKLNQHLMQINYTIESTHKQGCFVKCPEEYCNTN